MKTQKKHLWQRMYIAKIILTVFLLQVIAPPAAEAARIKDIATIEGFSGVQLIGYGLVTGLANTGDTQQSLFTNQTVASMLKRFGITIPQDTRVMRTRNVAAVMVTATIKNFSRKGMKFDVQVSSMGDATSLQGGMLLMTPLTGTDGRVYGMAQGGVSVGGYDFRSNQSRVSKNFVSSGRVPGGAILEIDVEGNILNENSISVLLREPDFTTAQRIAQAINRLPGLNNAAEALDAVAIRVQLPGTPTQSQVMQYITQIEAAQVTVDPAARVVINERTGTIVVGSNVELLPAVISHGGLEIQIQTENSVAMPAPFTIAEPQRVSNSYLSATEEYNKAVVINGTSTVQDMAAALNSLRVTPRDLIAIFQALKESGALQAELIIQ